MRFENSKIFDVDANYQKRLFFKRRNTKTCSNLMLGKYCLWEVEESSPRLEAQILVGPLRSEMGQIHLLKVRPNNLEDPAKWNKAGRESKR